MNQNMDRKIDRTIDCKIDWNISIELACAFTQPQYHRTIEVAAGSVLSQALEHPECVTLLQQIAANHADIALQDLVFGIYARTMTNPDQNVLQAGDRIEIYRPLLLDPIEARLRRSKNNTSSANHPENH